MKSVIDIYNLDIITECDIMLVHRPGNAISYGIREITDSYYNHLAIRVKIDGIYFVIEAEYPRVRMLLFEDWKEINKSRIYRIYAGEKCVKNPLFFVNKKYELVVFLREICLFLCIKSFGNESSITIFLSNKNDENKWFCFELGAEIIGLSNAHLATGNTFEKYYENNTNYIQYGK